MRLAVPPGRSIVVSAVRRVIVGVGGSPGCLPALRYAQNVARRNDAPLVAVHAWVPPSGEFAGRRYPSPPFLREFWKEAAHQRLREAVDAAWGGLPDGLALQLVIIRGEPAPALIDVASFTGDLLVVGAGRRGPMARIRHGRVSRYCLAHALCPVLTVPPPVLAQTAGRGLRAWSFRHRELTVASALPGGPDGEKLGRDRG
jgi:nucleotide-binding universal stress UspA family protein